MTQPWVMGNNCVKYYPDPTIGNEELWPGHRLLVYVHYDLGDITLVQGHDTSLGHGQQLCEV